MGLIHHKEQGHEEALLLVWGHEILLLLNYLVLVFDHLVDLVVLSCLVSLGSILIPSLQKIGQ